MVSIARPTSVCHRESSGSLFAVPAFLLSTIASLSESLIGTRCTRIISETYRDLPSAIDSKRDLVQNKKETGIGMGTLRKTGAN